VLSKTAHVGDGRKKEPLTLVEGTASGEDSAAGNDDGSFEEIMALFNNRNK
jgi:hypothetical protein